MRGRVILSLCDFTGNWSAPYREAGYEVRAVDLAHGQDVRLLPCPDVPVHGILAAPPCDHFSKAGGHLWAQKGDAALLEGLSVVDACLRLVAVCRPSWWALENPAGRLRRYIGPPAWSFQPWQFGDAWTKQTYLWGCFTPPLPLFSEQARQEVEPVMPGKNRHRDLTSRYSGTGKGKQKRSETPPGFALAFFEANR